MENKISTTYLESVEKFIEIKDLNNSQINTELLIQYATYLDSFSVLDDKIKLLAYEKAREIDGEVLREMAKHIPHKKLTQIVTTIQDRFKHKKAWNKTDTI